MGWKKKSQISYSIFFQLIDGKNKIKIILLKKINNKLDAFLHIQTPLHLLCIW